MMRIIILLLSAQNILFSGIKLEDFSTLEVEERIKIFEHQPAGSLAEITDLLGLYAIALKDENEDVRYAAAAQSSLLLSSLQSSPDEIINQFSNADKDNLQRALFESLKSENHWIRAFASKAIVFSNPVNPDIERILDNQIGSQKSDESKVFILEAMALVGYDKTKLSNHLLDIMTSTENSTARNSSGKILGFLKNEDSLNTLIELALNPEHPAAEKALSTIGYFGKNANSIRPELERIINGNEHSDDMVNLAKFILETINKDTPKSTSLRALPVRELWPLNIPSDEGFNDTKEAEKGSNVGLSQNGLSEENMPSDSNLQKPTEEPRDESFNLLPWLIGILILLTVLGITLRSRKNS